MGGSAAIQRYKGLGEMNAEQLWETTMIQISGLCVKWIIDSLVEADRVFSIDGRRSAAKKGIYRENAVYANIDA